MKDIPTPKTSNIFDNVTLWSVSIFTLRYTKSARAYLLTKALILRKIFVLFGLQFTVKRER